MKKFTKFQQYSLALATLNNCLMMYMIIMQ